MTRQTPVTLVIVDHLDSSRTNHTHFFLTWQCDQNPIVVRHHIFFLSPNPLFFPIYPLVTKLLNSFWWLWIITLQELRKEIPPALLLTSLPCIFLINFDRLSRIKTILKYNIISIYIFFNGHFGCTSLFCRAWKKT